MQLSQIPSSMAIYTLQIWQELHTDEYQRSNCATVLDTTSNLMQHTIST